MRRIVAQVRKELTQIVRDWRTLALALVLPVVMLLLMSAALSLTVSNLPIVVQDFDGSSASNNFIDAFRASISFHVVAWPVDKSAEEALASNAAAVRYFAEATSVPKGEIGSKSDMARVPFADILRLVEQGDPKACRALHRVAHHLGIGIAMLATGLAPDVLVVVGEVTRAWEKVEPVVAAVVRRRLSARASIRIVAGDAELQPRLRGTIALVLQKHFVAPSIA